MKAKKGLFMACVCIVLALVLMAGATYALFTDEVKLTNHLVAGDLEISLERTSLTATYLTNTGRLAKTTDINRIDYTDDLNDDVNMFGLDGSDIVMAPGCARIAKMFISNGANVAFGYYLVFTFDANTVNENLLKQLYLTVKTSNDDITYTDVYYGYLLADDYAINTNGETVTITVKDATKLGGYLSEVEVEGSQYFTVEVKFDNLDAETNNKAQSDNAHNVYQTLTFDMVVMAEQLMEVIDETANNPVAPEAAVPAGAVTNP